MNLPDIGKELSDRLASPGPIAHVILVLLFFSLLFALFFSPVLFSGLLLAPGDGVPLNLPNFYSPKVLWDPLLLGGFPMVGDPQMMRWYPPALISSLIPGSWNIFIVSAYVLAGSFTYGYVYTVTRSRLAALIGGITYGMCGFMMAHLGHTVIIHSVAWIPLMIWSIEKLRHQWSPGWLIAGSVGVTCSFFGGHSQVFFYGLLLTVSYAAVLGWIAPVGRWRFYSIAALMLVLGVGLATIQIVPTAELAGQSVRTEFSFADFVSYALPPKQLLLLIFPALFGLSNHPTNIYFGEWNLTELTGYVGLLPLLLAGIAVIVRRRELLTVFWASAGLLALLLALGDATPLANLLYYIPVINNFRAPARHLAEFGFAISILSGLGVAAIFQKGVSRRAIAATVVAGAAGILLCLLILSLLSKPLAELASAKDAPHLSVLPWENRAILIPLTIFLIATATLIYWYRRPASPLRGALLISVLILDLGSFGWFYEWQYASPHKSELTPPTIAVRYKALLDADAQRLLPIRGIHGSKSEIPPNRSRLWGVPSATGNNVLRLARFSHLLSMAEGGDVDPSWKDPDNRSTDILAIRYLFLPPIEANKDANGVSWLKEDTGLWLGSGCDRAQADSFKLSFPAPIRATTIGIVSRLACSVGIADETEVIRVSATDGNGGVQTMNLAAGRDTAEWAVDCTSVQPQMKHRRATVFRDYPAMMFDQPCTGHLYVTMLRLERGVDIKNLQFQWIGTSGAALIEKVTLIDEPSKSSTPLDLTVLDNSRWRYVAESGESRVLENSRAMPRVWLASEVVNINPEEALKILKSSRMPDGGAFDPLRTALIEEPSVLPAGSPDPAASARLAHLSASTMEVRIHSKSPAFLVSSDPYYPGWQATLDGNSVPILRANYAIRGVFVPAGDHTVRFEFKPRSFYVGVAGSSVSLLGLILIAVIPYIRRVNHQLDH